MQRTQQQWLALFQARKDSDLSIKQFCLEQGISTSSFYKNKAAFTTTLPSPFSQVQRIDPDNKSTPHEIKVNVGNVELTLDGKTDIMWLASLVEQLA